MAKLSMAGAAVGCFVGRADVARPAVAPLSPLCPKLLPLGHEAWGKQRAIQSTPIIRCNNCKHHYQLWKLAAYKMFVLYITSKRSKRRHQVFVQHSPIFCNCLYHQPMLNQCKKTKVRLHDETIKTFFTHSTKVEMLYSLLYRPNWPVCQNVNKLIAGKSAITRLKLHSPHCGSLF